MLKLHKMKFAAVAALALSGMIAVPALQAGTATTEPTGKDSKALVEETKKSCITGDLGVTFVTKYFSRGILQEDQGVIAQPYADIFFKVYDGGDTGFINNVTLNASVWSSLHSHHTGYSAGNSLASWYEFDYTPGLAITFEKNFTLTGSYFEFDSPNGAFQPARSININLAYNDTDLLGKFALHPHFTVLREIAGVAGLGGSGWYYEPGIAPSFTIVKDGPLPVTLTLPITAGFGSADFYAGDCFGYFSGGAQVGVGLGFIPACLGTWTTTVGATYYYLHEHLAIVDANRHNDWVGSAAIGVAF